MVWSCFLLKNQKRKKGFILKNKRIQLTTPSQPGAENFNRVNRQCRKCFPCTKEAKAEFDKAVLGAYQQALTQGQTAVQKQESPAQQQEQGQPVMGGM
jgi:hypothetical protein